MDEMRNFGAPAAIAGSYDFDLSTVDNQSDLDIQQWDLSVGADYKVDDNFSVGLGFTYLRYDDDEPYLYDGTGDAYITNISVAFLF